MADTIKLKAAIGEKSTHLLPFYFWGTGKATRLEIAWKLLQGRTVLWFGKDRKDWGTIPAQEVRDLADEATRLVNALSDAKSSHNAEMKRYEAALDALNAKLPEADLEAEVARLQAHVDKFEALYEAARHDLGNEQVRAMRLQRALETIWVVSDQTDVIQAANDALAGKEAEE